MFVKLEVKILRPDSDSVLVNACASVGGMLVVEINQNLTETTEINFCTDLIGCSFNWLPSFVCMAVYLE